MQSRSTAADWVGRSGPDHSDDVEVAERHDGGRHDEDVRGQEDEVDFALPLGRVAERPARQHWRAPSSAAVVGRLDEDEELRQREEERHQPRGDHLERDRRLASAQIPKRLDQHLHAPDHSQPPALTLHQNYL